MEKRDIIVKWVVLVLGVVSYAAGILAELIRTTKDIYSTSHVRIYPRRETLPLGIIAALAPFIAHVTIIIETSWHYYNRSDDRPFFFNRTWALICVSVSCITTIIAIVMFVVGFGVLIDPEKLDTLVSAAPWCYCILSFGVFFIGSLSSYFSVNFNFLWYRNILFAKYTDSVQAPHQIV